MAAIISIRYGTQIQSNTLQPQYAVISFFLLRALTKIATSFETAVTHFLVCFFASNIKVKAMHRVQHMMQIGQILSISISFVMSGLVFWMSGFVSNIVFVKS